MSCFKEQERENAIVLILKKKWNEMKHGNIYKPDLTIIEIRPIYVRETHHILLGDTTYLDCVAWMKP